MEGVPFTIVGVAPRGFKGFGLLTEPDVAVPLTTSIGANQSNYVQGSLDTGIDGRVFAFTAAVTVAAGVLCAWLPAWSNARRDRLASLRYHAQSMTASNRLLKVLLAGQLTLSVVLLTNAGFLVRSLQRVLSVDLGFNSDDVVRASFATRPGVDKRPDRGSYYPALLERVKALPGVSRASISRMAPGSPSFKWLVSPMSWEPTEGISAAFNSVTPDFFGLLDIRVLAGRDFAKTDHARAPRVAILSRALAQRLFPDGNVLGQRVRIGTQPYRQDLEMVGIVADARLHDVKDASSYSAHISELQDSEPTMGGWLVILGHPDDRLLQGAVQSIGPDFVNKIDRIADALGVGITPDRIAALLAGIFGMVTLVLAALGVGGLFAHSVLLRRKETAIRLALGAKPGLIVKSIVREGVLIAAAGIAVGLSLSVASADLIRGVLFGVDSHDPIVLISVPIVLGAVAMFACLLPALRAARMDLSVGLRVD